jgi:hypothetical protein
MAKAPAPKPAAKPKAASKSKSSFDFMAVLMQYGDKAGLIGAGSIAALLTLLYLFWPGSGFMAESPDGKAKELEDKARSVQQQMASAQPTEAHLPPSDGKTRRLTLDTTEVKSDKFMLASLIPDVTATAGIGRRVPSIFAIDEAVGEVGRIQVKSYILSRDLSTITCLEVDTTSGDTPKLNFKGFKNRFRQGSGAPGFPGGAPGFPGGSPGGAPGGGPGMPGMPGMPGGMPGGPGYFGSGPDQSAIGGDRRPKRAVQVKVEDLEKKSNLVPAIQIRPERVVVIAASFPYKKQIEEFQAKLNLRSAAEVLSEASSEQTNPVLNSFRFLRVDVERRELDLDGNPKGEWVLQDLKGPNAPYRMLFAAAGRETEPESGSYTQLMFGGLAMPRLKQFRADEFSMSSTGGAPGGAMGSPGGAFIPDDDDRGRPGGGAMPGKQPTGKEEKSQYPAVEMKLKNIVATLEKLKEKPITVASKPSRFDSGDNFDPFNTQGPPAGSSEPLMPGPGGMPMPGNPGSMGPGVLPGPGLPGIPGGPVGPGGPAGSGSTQQEITLPEHCLIRIVDVNVAPGHAYEYRMRVVMANPNRGRKDVANPRYEALTELASDWSTLPIKVRLEPELHYFVVDQKAVEQMDNPRARYEGPYSRSEIKPNMLMMQSHLWLRNTKLNNGADLIVGEWTIAERFPAFRGEYVGRTERVKVPVWSYTRESFNFPRDHKKLDGIEVHFGYKAGGGQPEPILVDFQRGRTTYDYITARTEDKIESAKVSDESNANALILNPDGRLILAEGADDMEDKTRIERLNAVRTRLKEVEKGNKPAPNPMNPGDGGLGGRDS